MKLPVGLDVDGVASVASGHGIELIPDIWGWVSEAHPSQPKSEQTISHMKERVALRVRLRVRDLEAGLPNPQRPDLLRLPTTFLPCDAFQDSVSGDAHACGKQPRH